MILEDVPYSPLDEDPALSGEEEVATEDEATHTEVEEGVEREVVVVLNLAVWLLVNSLV